MMKLASEKECSQNGPQESENDHYITCSLIPKYLTGSETSHTTQDFFHSKVYNFVTVQFSEVKK